MALVLCVLVCIAALLTTGTHAAGPILADLWVNFPTPSNPPSPRHSHSAVFNPWQGSMIVFGGNSGDDAGLDDTSMYTVETSLWETNVETYGIPPLARYGHTAVATALNRMIIFGGRNATSLMNDFAVLDMDTRTWLNITVNGTVMPTPRAYHTAVIDRYQHVMYVYGGISSLEDGTAYYSDMFMLDLDHFVWTQANGTAVPRAMHSAVMSLSGVMVVFGGVGLSDVACFDARNHSWYECLMDPSPAPAVRYGHTAVYSPLQMMVVYGGRNDAGNPTGDVWNFDLNTFVWHIVSPGGASINPRAFHTAVATTFGSMILWGGIDGDNVISNDFGLYNLANTVLRSANDGAVLVVLVTLLGTIVLALCFAMDYMKEKNEEEKDEALLKARKENELLIPKLPQIPKALQIPLGPRAQKFFDEFKMSLDPMQEPPK